MTFRPEQNPDHRFNHLKAERNAGVATITLIRPDRLNALGIGPGSNREELLVALHEADADDQVGVILLNAAGRAFCGGGDLTGAAPREHVLDDYRFHEAAESFHEEMRRIHKPLIAAVNGLCLGAGLSLIAQCDLVIAADDAVFGLVEGRIGLTGASSIVHLVGAPWAKFLMLTGEMIDAVRAERIGLVLAVVPRDDLHDRSFELARRIAALPRESVLLDKAGIDRQVDAAGLAAGRVVAQAMDPITTAMGRLARAPAPDGRLFRDILKSEGIEGLKRARDLQYREPWLEPLVSKRDRIPK